MTETIMDQILATQVADIRRHLHDANGDAAVAALQMMLERAARPMNPVNAVHARRMNRERIGYHRAISDLRLLLSVRDGTVERIDAGSGE